MIINAGIKKVFIMTGEKQFRQIEIRKWVNNNLGEVKKIKGKWTFAVPEGYGYRS
jgi:deoxycytidylate deaminase